MERNIDSRKLISEANRVYIRLTEGRNSKLAELQEKWVSAGDVAEEVMDIHVALTDLTTDKRSLKYMPEDIKNALLSMLRTADRVVNKLDKIINYEGDE